MSQGPIHIWVNFLINDRGWKSTLQVVFLLFQWASVCVCEIPLTVVFNMVTRLMENLNEQQGRMYGSHISCCLLVFSWLELSLSVVPLQELFEATCLSTLWVWFKESVLFDSHIHPCQHQYTAIRCNRLKVEIGKCGCSRPVCIVGLPTGLWAPHLVDMTFVVWHMAKSALQNWTICY